MNKKVSGILLCAAALLLVSCKNFLKGQETAEQIQAAINYANSDFTLIKVQPQKGTGTVVKPAGGEALQRPSDVFDLVFEPSVDYEFVTWKVSSKSVTDAQILLNYIEIDDPNKAETTVTFRRPLEDIIITPVVVRRPKILSYSPVYTGSLSLKDARIQVIFDRKMDPSSIYYSPDEINELKAEFGLRDQDFLPENSVPGAANIYGYKKNGEYIYKNITIKNNDSQKSINNRFEAPYFESPTTLIIPANRDNLPENYTFISVSLDKSFCYNYEYQNIEYENMSKKIGLFESKDWVYQVSNQDDNIPPTISNLEIKKKDSNNQKKDLQILPYYEGFNSISCTQKIENLIEKKIYIKFKAGDDGSGVAPYFDIILNRLIDKNYNFIDPQTITTLKTYYTNIGRESEYDGYIDLSNYPEGLYSLCIYLYDNNGATQDSSITIQQGNEDPVKASGYFIIDDNIYVSEPSIVDIPDYKTKVEITWDPPNDLKSVDIRYKKDGEQNWTSIDQITDIFIESTPKNSKIIESLEYGTNYTFEITFTDWYGHSKTFTKTYKTKGLSKPTINNIVTYSNGNCGVVYSFDISPSKEERIYFICSNDEDFSDVTRYDLEADKSEKAIRYDILANYTYFQIRVYPSNNSSTFEKSKRWKLYTFLGMNPYFYTNE